MTIASKKLLSPNSERAKRLLEEALGILDDEGEAAAACMTCAAIERLTAGPGTLEHWRAMTDHGDPEGPDTEH